MISNLISMYENVDSDLFLKDKSVRYFLNLIHVRFLGEIHIEGK